MQVSMDAISQGHMSYVYSLALSTLFQFMGPKSNISSQIVRGDEVVDCRVRVVHERTEGSLCAPSSISCSCVILHLPI